MLQDRAIRGRGLTRMSANDNVARGSRFDDADWLTLARQRRADALKAGFSRGAQLHPLLMAAGIAVASVTLVLAYVV